MTPQEIDQCLLRNGLRPTRQRRAIAGLLFAGTDRHVFPEQLHQELAAKGTPTALATVYNTLHQFRALGLLREVVVGPNITCFDTNTSPHCHIYNEDSGELSDVAPEQLGISMNGINLPQGTALSRVDVVVRVRNQDT